MKTANNKVNSFATPDQLISGNCPKCNMPLEICVCDQLVKQSQKIRVRLVKRKFGKTYTIIDGLDSKLDLKGITKKLKSKLACGGSLKNGVIELQGDHRFRLKQLLPELGFPLENIDIS